MNKKTSPTLIGAFIVGAVVLLVIAVIAFGSGRLFKQSKEFVLYFDNSVNGLRVGAPVKFKGVEIGSVKDIRLQLGKDTQINKIPVIIKSSRKTGSPAAYRHCGGRPRGLSSRDYEQGARGQRDGEFGHDCSMSSRSFPRHTDSYGAQQGRS